MRKIIAIVVVFLCLFGMIGCTPFPSIWGFDYPNIEYAEWDGSFWYYSKDNSMNSESKWYYILGANPELGKSPENLEKLYVPAEYKGGPVMYYVYYDGNGSELYGLDITSVKELYYSYNTPLSSRFMGDTKNTQYTKLVVPSATVASYAPVQKDVLRSKSDNVDVFLPAINFEEIYKNEYKSYGFFLDDVDNAKNVLYKDFNIEIVNEYCFLLKFTFADETYMLGGKSFTSTIYKANTAFMFNYEGAPNMGYFFINDFERGGLIENYVYEPTREGYTFNGWYKDSECTQKWDFEVDTLPAPTYDENGQLEFIETKLYAGWTKI